MSTIRLGDIAHTRSGDKGNNANVGVVANDATAYELLRKWLTSEEVTDFFAPMGIGAVARYELPGIHAFNFVIENALAGGASQSLRLETQGKTFGTMMLELRLELPEEQAR